MQVFDPSDERACPEDEFLVCVAMGLGDEEPQAEVMLNCEGKPSCGRWVKHRYVTRRRAEWTDRNGRLQLGDEEVYACSGCGAQRRFGMRKAADEGGA